jgi:hypothetical protein
LAAEKAAEQAAEKAKQDALEEEQRKKREEERFRREAQRKAQEEEKQKKEDEQRRKRIIEEKEREAEKERKRNEREEKAKTEKREKERERRAREEREAKIAAEKATAAAAKREQEKEEREKKLSREREAKAEQEARERTIAAQQPQQPQPPQQQRTVTTKSKPPSSPTPVSVPPSNSSPRTPTANGAPKKILNKSLPVPAPPAPPVPAPPAPVQATRQQPRPPAVMTSSQPAASVPPQVPPHISPPMNQVYGQGTGMLSPSAISPRLPYSPTQAFHPGAPIQQVVSATLPRNFGNSAPPFDPSFGRGHAPTAPIAPPSKAVQIPMASPAAVQPAGPSRRASAGPVARPIVPIAPIPPIARPTAEPPSSGSASPRRSPSPKGILGSSALIADEDEVITPIGRRTVPGTVGVVGENWSTGNSHGMAEHSRTPWGPPAPPGIISPRPLSVENVWGNNPAEWNTFYGGTAFVHDTQPTHSGN